MTPSLHTAILSKETLRMLICVAGMVLALPALGWASPPGEDALTTLNRFLADSAPSTPAYRTELRRGTDPEPASHGRLAGSSPLIGPFTYRAKTYAELTQVERADLLRDGRFHAYLLEKSRTFSIHPEDMLEPQPLIVPLDPP
jgi:hypothetical protein